MLRWSLEGKTTIRDSNCAGQGPQQAWAEGKPAGNVGPAKSQPAGPEALESVSPTPIVPHGAEVPSLLGHQRGAASGRA